MQTLQFTIHVKKIYAFMKHITVFIEASPTTSRNWKNPKKQEGKTYRIKVRITLFYLGEGVKETSSLDLSHALTTTTASNGLPPPLPERSRAMTLR